MLGCEHLLSILLFILKIIGITVASILGIILLLICLILFVPIRYRVIAKKDAELYALIKVSWLLRLLYIRVEYVNEQLSYVLRVFGFRIPLEKKQGKKKKETVTKSSKPKRNNADVTKEQIEQHSPIEPKEPIKSLNPEPSLLEQKKVKQSDQKAKKRHSFFQTVKDKWIQLKQRVRRIKNKIQEILSNIKVVRSKVVLLWKFITSDENRPGMKEIFQSVKKIMKSIAPRKIVADVHFGTGDPCSTGQALGAISLIHMPFANQIRIQPDFEEKVLEGEAMVAGRIQIFSMIRIAFHLYRNKQFKRLLKNFTILKEEL